MSRRPTENGARPVRELLPPAARRLVRGVCIALLTAGAGAGALPAQPPPPPPAGVTEPSAGAQTAGGAATRAPDASTQPAGAAGAPFVGPPEPGIEELAEGLYLVTGHGSNAVARVTPEGVIVAGEPTARSATVASSIGTVTDRPVRYLIRTHRRGNDPVAPPAAWENATVVAAEPRATRASGGNGRSPAPPPDLGYTRALTLFLGAAEVQLRHFAPAHTGGDTVVLFPDLGVLYAGDLVVRGLPFIDYASGGSSRGWVEALAGILALDFEIAVPGSGPTLTKRDVQVFRDRFVTLRMRTLQLLYRDVAREDALPLLRTADLDWPLAPGGPFAARSFPALYEELAVEREEAREAGTAASDRAAGDPARP